MNVTRYGQRFAGVIDMPSRAERFASLKDRVEDWRDELHVPGCVFGVSVDGERFTGGRGITSVDNPLSVTDATTFQIGSITKTFTATALMMLAEQGKLNLKDRVRRYLPEFRVRDSDASEQVTIEQTLTHLAGWAGDVFTDTGMGDEALGRYVEGMEFYAQLAPVGTVFSYNNAAFCVSGRIIEVVAGQRYEDVIRDMILQPLGMESATFFPHEAMLRRFAVGHLVLEGEARVLSPWAIPRGMNPAGGISCHIHDLLRYAEFHLGDGDGLLKAKSLSDMRRERARINAYMGAVGLSWIMNSHGGKRVIWHTGGTNGQNAVLSLAPDLGFALGMMTNGSGGGRLHDRFNKAALREFCGIAIPEPAPIASTVDELAPYVGVYRGIMREIELWLDGGELLAEIREIGDFPTDRELSAPEPATVARCGEDQILVVAGEHEGMRGDFIRDDAGEIQYLRFGSRINRRVS